MGNAYLMVVLGILAAKGIGFYRDMVFAQVFGTGIEADIYFQVFGLVNLIFTGIGMALSTLVIKNINKTSNIGRERMYAAVFLRKSLFYMVLAAVVIALCARPIISIILPDISGESLSLALKMMYVMIPSLVFVVIAYIISGILQNEKAYFITSIMSLPFNTIIILYLMIPNVSVFTVAIVTTVGWFLQIVIMLPQFYKKGYSFLKKSEVAQRVNGRKTKNPEILWIFISNMMFQLCFYIDRSFVSGNEGMASAFNYASNLFITISSVFVVAMSTVVFPSVSKNYEEGNVDYVNELLRYIITVMAAIFLPFLLTVGLFGEDVIRLIYERGSFTPESTKAVSTMFFIYSLGILGYVSQELFNKILYLAGKYKYTVVGTVAVVVANVIINIFISNHTVDSSVGTMMINDTALKIAVSTTILLTLYAVMIAVSIRKVVGPYWKKDLLADILKIAVSGVLAFAVYALFNTMMPAFTHGYITFVVPLGASGIVYIASLLCTGVLKRLIKREKRGAN